MKRYALEEHYAGINGGELFFYDCDLSPEEKIKNKNPAAIVIPGGGYAEISHREGTPVALKFLAKGFCVFVLKYACASEV